MKVSLGGFLLRLLLLGALAAATVIAILEFSADRQELRIKTLEESLADLQAEYVPLKFMVIARDSNSLTVRFRLYNLAGHELGLVETSLPGRQLFFDFLAAPRQNVWLIFPYRIFTEQMAPEQGTLLDAIVAPAGLPLNYSGGAFESEVLIELGDLYRALVRGEAVSGAFGNAVHDVAELSSFSMNVVYKIVARKKGGIEIVED